MWREEGQQDEEMSWNQDAEVTIRFSFNLGPIADSCDLIVKFEKYYV